jgi:hypothetical protein
VDLGEGTLDLSIKVIKATKYLRVITGDDKAMATKAIHEREAQVYKRIEA